MTHYLLLSDNSKVLITREMLLDTVLSLFQEASINTTDALLADILDALDDVIKENNDTNMIDMDALKTHLEEILMNMKLYNDARKLIISSTTKALEEASIREEEIESGTLKLLKRNKKIVGYNKNKLIKFLNTVININKLLTKVDINMIVEETEKQLYDGMGTVEVLKSCCMAVRSYIEKHPEYSYMAARIQLIELYREVFSKRITSKDQLDKTYKEHLEVSLKKGVESGRLDKRLLEFDIETLSKHIKPERDYLLDYIGVATLYDRYVLFITDKNIKIEAPQHFWMRVAMGLAINEAPQDRTKYAIEFYNTMSTLQYLPSTPTLYHSGMTFNQLSSCYIMTVYDDLQHIFKSYGDCAEMLKYSGGVGHDWSNLRSVGSFIKKTNAYSSGIVPFLKIMNDTTVCINRAGKRRGASVAYLETWHYEIEEFLQLRKNTGDERRRTHDMNTAHWIPDLFMKRVLENGDWQLFSPDEVPDLHHIYATDFEEKYKHYEQQAKEGKMKITKTIKAVQLWRQMITMLFETGHPWLCFKDACNTRSPQDHMGTVHSSNLCTEITLNNDKDEVAVCNLGSINIGKCVLEKSNTIDTIEGYIDTNKLINTIEMAVRMLDNVIDLNYYPIPETANSNLKHRPIGLGIMGLQEVFSTLHIPYDSDEAVIIDDRIMEFISYYTLLSSSKLAKEKGAYSTYKGSKWDRGLLPYDTFLLHEEKRGVAIPVDKHRNMDWDSVYKHIKEYGMRNSNTMAIAPTSNIGLISGATRCIEPTYKNLFVMSNLGGEFTNINTYLVDELESLGIWNDRFLQRLKLQDGSLQAMDDIPTHIKRRYKEVFEIDYTWLIKHAAVRAKWIDQSQSVNLFYKGTSGKDISDMYQYAWIMGLKTTYYLRTLAATQVEKASVSTTEMTQKRVMNSQNDDMQATLLEDKTPKKQYSDMEKMICSIANKDECEACQ